MAFFVGANGSGKSTLFDVFSFLRDALVDNVDVAVRRRGGFAELRTREQTGNIELEIKFREKGGPLITYHLSVGERDGRAFVAREVLKYSRGQQGRPWSFLDFQEGFGSAIVNESDYVLPDPEMKWEDQRLDAPDILAIKGLGQFERFRAVSAFRRFIERWHLSDFHIQAARPSQEEGHAEHLSPTGENLPLVTRFIHERHPVVFNRIMTALKQRVPGISHVEATRTVDGRLVLRFQDGAYRDPFVARHVSDGTIKMFAYLVLLNDPRPHPLICIEEPENQLYPAILNELVEEFRGYAERGGQVFVSTHSPEVLNAAEPDEVFWLTKKDGVTSIQAVSKHPRILALLEEGDKLGSLWRQGFFDGAHPV